MPQHWRCGVGKIVADLTEINLVGVKVQDQVEADGVPAKFLRDVGDAVSIALDREHIDRIDREIRADLDWRAGIGRHRGTVASRLERNGIKSNRLSLQSLVSAHDLVRKVGNVSQSCSIESMARENRDRSSPQEGQRPST